MTSDLIIVGAGASGLVAAISAARILKASEKKQSSNASGVPARKNSGSVIVFERMGKPGKKLLATGNGRCNYTNMHMLPDCFHSDSPKLLKTVLDRFGCKETVDFFENLGIVPKNRDGYIYPLSNQASAVVDVLLMELSSLSVRIITDTCICFARKTKKGFELTDQHGRHHSCRRLILSGGGCASPKLGSDGSGFSLAKQLGHRIIPPVPALTGLYAEDISFKSVAGVRSDGSIALFAEDTCIATDRGELQLTGYGVSGIPAFQVSRFAARALQQRKKVTARLDFLPDTSAGALFLLLKQRIDNHPDKTAGAFLIGMFNAKLCAFFNRLCSIDDHMPVKMLSKKQLGAYVSTIKQLTFQVAKTGDFSDAQVCAGGVSCLEIDSHLQSGIVPGLYITGELADVDGICGGYNLQWAWASGYIAGEHAGKELLC